MKTKEEILEQETNEVEDSFMLGNGVDFFDGKCSSVLKVMDEYAKELAIDFVEYLQKEGVSFEWLSGSFTDEFDKYLKSKSDEQQH